MNSIRNLQLTRWQEMAARTIARIEHEGYYPHIWNAVKSPIPPYEQRVSAVIQARVIEHRIDLRGMYEAAERRRQERWA